MISRGSCNRAVGFGRWVIVRTGMRTLAAHLSAQSERWLVKA
jgi:hypothetical protein